MHAEDQTPVIADFSQPQDLESGLSELNFVATIHSSLDNRGLTTFPGERNEQPIEKLERRFFMAR